MNNPEPVVFLVDDDAAVLKAVSRLLRAAKFDVVTYGSPKKFLEHCNPAMHGCIVLDMAMPEMSGLQLQEALAGKGATFPIIFLTGEGDIPTSVKAIKRGAADFLTKPVRQHELIAAVLAATAQDREARQMRIEISELRSRIETLTPREYEVLQRVIAGRLNKQAAAELGIAEKTVKIHRARVMDKLRVGTIVELVHVAERAGVTTSA